MNKSPYMRVRMIASIAVLASATQLSLDSSALDFSAMPQPKATTYLSPAKMLHPASTLISSRPGLVSLTWDADVDPTMNDIYVTVNAPGVTNGRIKATFVPVSYTDSGENMGYIYPCLDIDLASLITNPYNYGEWTLTIPEGVVRTVTDINPAQTLTFTWYKDNDEFTIVPSFSNFSEEAPSYSRDLLKTVKITWDGIAAVRRNSNVKGAYVAMNGSESRSTDIDKLITIEGDAAYIDLSGLETGKYKLYIPTSYFFLTPENGGTEQVNYSIDYMWFGISEGMSSGTPLPPFNAAGENIPSVASDVEYMDVEFPGNEIELTGNGTILMYPDLSADYREWAQEIPASNIEIVYGNILRIYYNKGLTLNENFSYSNFRLISIPEGFLRNTAGELNPLQKISFSVVEPIDVEPVWTPASGSVINPASDLITLSWPGASWINYQNGAYLEGDAIDRIYLKQNLPYLGIEGEINIGGTNSSLVTFDFSKLDLIDGNYTLVLPIGTFIMETATANPANQYLSYNFRVGEEQTVELLGQPNSVSPPQGNNPGLSLINLYWNNVDWDIPEERQNPYTLPSETNAMIHVTVNGETVEGAVRNIKAINTLISTEVSTSNGPAQLQVNFIDASFYWAGEITVVIEEGLITTTDGKINPRIELKYNVEKMYDGLPTSDPAPVDLEYPDRYTALGELDILTVEWPGLEVTQIRPAARFYLFLPADADGNEERVTVNPTLENGAIQFNLGNLTTLNGTYQLYIPENAVTLSNGMTNGPAQLSYIVNHKSDDVSTIIDTADGHYTIYTLNGVLVISNGNAADLNQLGNGLYIINGTKVLIAK